MKKVVSVLLCVLMVFGMMSTAAAAEDTSFSLVTGTSFSECLNAAVEGTDYVLSDEGATVTVNTADGYCKAVSLANATGSIVTKIVLNADIDMNLIDLTSIRPQQKMKMFTLDGNGHTMRQPSVTVASNSPFYCGLIATANYATVKDLTVEDAVMGSPYINGSAVILGNVVVKAVFENITVKNSKVTGYGKVGTILGLTNDTSADLTFRNVKAENNTVVGTYNVGGIAGLIKRAATLDCSNVTVENDTFVPLNPERDVYVTLDATVTCDGSADSCIGSGERVHGLYRDYAKSQGIDYNYYYFGGYARYWVVYGKTSHDCSADGITGYEIANSELVVNSLEKHEHKDFTLVQETPATCVSQGVSAYYVCECGIKLLKGDYPGGYMEFWDESVLTLPVNPDNHTGNTRTEKYKAATCSQSGYSGDVYCKDCGVLLENGTELPATGIHTDTDGDGKCDECGADYVSDCTCICHKDNIFSKIVRYLCTLFSKIFRTRIACCPDMELWNGRIKDLT